MSELLRSNIVDVAVGVIINASGEVLIAQRQVGQHLEGYWEFPGGKVELGENAQEALCRELLEELSIDVLKSQFLFDIAYSYPQKEVNLKIYRVDEFSGQPQGREGQTIRWCNNNELQQFSFPAANQAILRYLEKEGLPRRAP